MDHRSGSLLWLSFFGLAKQIICVVIPVFEGIVLVIVILFWWGSTSFLNFWRFPFDLYYLLLDRRIEIQLLYVKITKTYY